MPRYHFNTFDAELIQDEDGAILPDLKAARVEAVRSAGEMIRDAYRRIAGGHDWWMEVTDERRLLLYRLDFLITRAPAVYGDKPRP